MRLAVFLERDGLLNRVRIEQRHQISPRTLDEFQPEEAAIEPLRQLKDAGFVLIVTTNQPGLSRGYLARRELDSMHALLRRRFPVDDVLVCPHDEADRCPCRKPKPGLLLESAFNWHLDLDRSFVISDKWQDAEAAHIAGCTSLLLQSPWVGSGHHDFVLPDLPRAVKKTLQIHSNGHAHYRSLEVARI